MKSLYLNRPDSHYRAPQVAALDDVLFSDALADGPDARAMLYEALTAVCRGADEVRAAGGWYTVQE